MIGRIPDLHRGGRGSPRQEKRNEVRRSIGKHAKHLSCQGRLGNATAKPRSSQQAPLYGDSRAAAVHGAPPAWSNPHRAIDLFSTNHLFLAEAKIKRGGKAWGIDERSGPSRSFPREPLACGDAGSSELDEDSSQRSPALRSRFHAALSLPAQFLAGRGHCLVAAALGCDDAGFRFREECGADAAENAGDLQ